MSDVSISDILIKAAEDVQQGMWCRNDWFRGDDGERWAETELFSGFLSVEKAQGLQRCAEGSVALATLLLGGTVSDFDAAVDDVRTNLPNSRACGCDPATACRCDSCASHPISLAHHNDKHLPDDPFEAGQTLAELFRTTAESL